MWATRHRTGCKSKSKSIRRKQLGIAGFVVNWYGARHEFEDKAYTLMQQVAADKNFKVALMYDEDDSDPASATDAVIVDLQYAYDRYISPHAVVARDSYLRYNGRPLIFIFPKGGHTDWNRVRQTVNSWEDPPLLIFKDINQQYADAFDGFYAWVSPAKKAGSPTAATGDSSISITSTRPCSPITPTRSRSGRHGRASTIPRPAGARTAR